MRLGVVADVQSNLFLIQLSILRNYYNCPTLPSRELIDETSRPSSSLANQMSLLSSIPNSKALISEKKLAQATPALPQPNTITNQISNQDTNPSPRHDLAHNRNPDRQRNGR